MALGSGSCLRWWMS